MLEKSKEKLKEINLALGKLHDELTYVRFKEEERFEDLNALEWESYKVQQELAPCEDLDEAIASVEEAMEQIKNALTLQWR